MSNPHVARVLVRSCPARTRKVLSALLMASALAGCGAAPESKESAEVLPSAAAAPTRSHRDPLANPVVSGLFAVTTSGRRLALTCWGTGSPTVILEAGHPGGHGIEDFGAATFTRNLAERTKVCAYDRAGWGRSDPAPNKPRDADDVVLDLRTLLAEADVEVPYVLVGSSFGGMIVTYYAARHPNDVAGVVLLDVPAPSATLSSRHIPEIAWNHPSNLEHVDIAPEFENRFARHPLPIEAPLVVITATGGQSDVNDQRFWLQVSPRARQLELAGGHDIYRDQPQKTAEEILKLT